MRRPLPLRCGVRLANLLGRAALLGGQVGASFDDGLRKAVVERSLETVAP
ncbi:MAG: hypothetical protein ACYCX8_01865 [Acidimicrobiales bacterium]